MASSKARIAELNAVITGDDSQFQKTMARVEKRFGSLQKLSGQGGPLGALGKTFQAFQVSPVLKGLDVLRKSIQVLAGTAAEFEERFREVQAITSGSAADFQNLKESVQAVSTATEHTSVALLKASTVLGRAGFQAGEVGEALKHVANLATASGISVSEAANLSIRVLKSYGLELKDLEAVSDVLAKAAANANVSIAGLGEGFKFTGAIAQASGIEMNEVVTALSLLGETGLEAGLAGRALQAMLMDLSNPTDKAKRKLIEMGIVTHETENKMLPLRVILQQLADANMTAGDSFTIFNRNSARAVTALTRSTGDFKEFLRTLDSADGAIQQQSDTIRDSLNKQLDRMSNIVKTLGENIGESLLGPLTFLVTKFNDLALAIKGLPFDKMSDFFFGDGMGLSGLIAGGAAGGMAGSMLGPAGTFFGALGGMALGGIYGVEAGEMYSQERESRAAKARKAAARKAESLLYRDQPGVPPLLARNPDGSSDDELALARARALELKKQNELLDIDNILTEGIGKINEKFKVALAIGASAVDNFNLEQTARVAFNSILTGLKNEELLEKRGEEAARNVMSALEQYFNGAAVELQSTIRQYGEIFQRGVNSFKFMLNEFTTGGGVGADERGPLSFRYYGGTRQNKKIEAALANPMINTATVLFESAGSAVLDEIQGLNVPEISAIGGMIDTAMGSMGEFGSTVSTFAQVTAATGNPMMGAVAGLLQMATSTQSFKVLSIGLNTIFESLVGVLDVFLSPLKAFGALFFIIGVTIKALTPVLKVFELATKALMLVFKGIGYVIGGIVWAIAKVYNALADALDAITFGVVDLQRMDPNAVFDAIDEMDKLGEETRDTREEFKNLNEELKKSGNIPAGFKANLRAFQAALSDTIQVIRDTMGTGRTTRVGPQGELIHFQHGGVVPGVGFGDSVPAMLSPGEQVIPRGGVAGGVVIQSMVVQVADTKDFMRKLTREQEWNSMVRSGTPLRGKPSGVR